MYTIKIITDSFQVESAVPVHVDVYNWGGDYRPETTARLCFIEGKGFALRLCCKESNPTATVQPPYGHVCIDSCIEFFANFAPDVPHSPYINFEVNALGTMCCEFGEKGGVRPRFEANNIPFPTISTFKQEDCWGANLFIGLDTLKAVYGEDFTIGKGDRIRGNFFKCGDKTPNPHYGSYTKIGWEYPSFHQPQFFADMMIEA